MYNAPLFNELRKIKDLDVSPFFMPGHKMGRGISDIFSIDLTELKRTDDLHMPTGIIKKAQEELKRAYGSKESFFLVGGSTSGIETSFLAAFKPGDKVIIARDLHISVISSIILSGVKPIFVYPEFIEELGIFGGLDIDKIKEAYTYDVKGIFITRPNYFSLCSDIEKISEFAKEKDITLIVDEAHGAHFNFSEHLPKSALYYNADIVIQSAHKTMPALTQGSYLHLGTKRVSPYRIKDALRITQSSSPSFVLMAYLDLARAVMEKEGREKIDKVIEKNEEIRKNNLFIDKSYIGKYGIKDVDLSRLVLINENAKEIADTLEDEFKIECEMAIENIIVFLTGFANTDEDFKRLMEFSKKIPPKNAKKRCAPPKADKGFDIRETFFKDYYFTNSPVGKISASSVMIYPPGIAFLLPGEVITKEIYEYILDKKQKNENVLGIYDEGFKVLK